MMGGWRRWEVQASSRRRASSLAEVVIVVVGILKLLRRRTYWLVKTSSSRKSTMHLFATAAIYTLWLIPFRLRSHLAMQHVVVVPGASHGVLHGHHHYRLLRGMLCELHDWGVTQDLS